MVTVIEASDAATLAFRISGRLTRADYQDVLLPPVRAKIERGEPLRMLAVIDDFQGLEAGALLQDLMAAAKLGAGQRSYSSRFAVVSETDWVRRAVALSGWLVPGELRVFPPAERADAEVWLAAKA